MMPDSVRVAVVAACCSLAAGASSQAAKNVELLSTFLPRTQCYSDVWGYHDPATGKEYALLTSQSGTYVVDCTDPRNPVQRGLIPSESPGRGNEWQDVKTVGSHAYVVSEAYGGLQVIDLSNPDSPRRVGRFGRFQWFNAHNVAADVAAEKLYVCGTNIGTHVIDVAQPTSPRLVFSLGNPYVHDLAVEGGFAYLCDMNGNRLDIRDTTQLPGALPQVGSTSFAGSSIAHAVWPSRDGTICIGTNEEQGGPVSVFDVSDKRLPKVIATWRAPTGAPMAIPHNVMIADRIGHVSYYTEGYRVLDLADPGNPLEVGFYDTSTLPAGGYDGAWGVYAGQPSGVVYVSDIQGGLFVLGPKATGRRYGVATTGSAGATPEIHAFGAPYRGNARFALQVEDAPPSRPGVLVVGTGRAALSVGGITVNVALAGSLIVPLASDARGRASVSAPISTGAPLGSRLQAQFLFADTGQGLDVSATRGLEIETFAP